MLATADNSIHSSSTLSENQEILSVTYLIPSVFFSETELFFLIEKKFKMGGKVFFFNCYIFPRLVLDIPMMLLKSSVKQRYSMFAS